MTLLFPPRPKHFTDREKELAQLLTDLQPDRVVTLCGPGGIGKSALAAEALWTLAPGNELPPLFPDGIIFHNFHGRPDSDLALEHIVLSLGEEPKGDPAGAALRALAKRRILLILDGAEEADNLAAVLDVRGNCTVLVTSRTHKDAVTEWQDLKPLAADDAVALLCKWGSNQANQIEAAKEICKLVGYLPLAVRLIGRYLAETRQPAAEYMEWLQASPLEALNQGQRQKESVPILLDRSLAQVNDKAHEVLAIVGLLALMSFGCDPIVAALEVPTIHLHQSLGQLVSYSLLSRSGDRYEVSHTLIHTYIQQRLSVSSEVVERLACYYTRLVAEQSQKGAVGYRLLAEERLHLMRVLDRCKEQQAWQAAIDLAQAIDNYLNDQGHWTDRVTANEIGRKAAHQLSDWPGECIFMDNLGRTWDVLGEEDKAITVFSEALGISDKINNPVDRNRIKSRILDHIGSVYHHKGQIKEAIENYHKALELAQEISDLRGQDRSLCSLGRIYTEIGPVEQAIEYIEQALQIARNDLKDSRRESVDLGYLGEAYIAKWKLGPDNETVEKAKRHYEHARQIAEEKGDRRGEGKQLLNLGKVYGLLGQGEQARVYIKAALFIAREIGDLRLEREGQAAIGKMCNTL